MGRRGANPNGHWTRGYTDEGIIETIIWQQLAARRMLEMMDLSSVPHADVTYGDLVNTPRIITSYLPSGIETIPDFQVPEIRNANDNRWKEDEVFVQMWNRYKDIFNA
jgi:hypothetical protein